MKEPYKRKLINGSEIYIPNWAVDVALENLTQAGKVLGSEHVINISELNQAGAIVALMNAENPQLASRLVKHFICQVRIDGNKITPETINNMFDGQLDIVLELFTHVIHSQYADFFSSGLAKVVSPEPQ
tara:strand:- start:57 stop:443 length:387 start_codon:yes stop_codon:yes gene_type:complete